MKNNKFLAIHEIGTKYILQPIPRIVIKHIRIQLPLVIQKINDEYSIMVD